MQLLRDNLTLWTSDMQGDGELIVLWWSLQTPLTKNYVIVLGEGEPKEPLQDVDDQDAS